MKNKRIINKLVATILSGLMLIATTATAFAAPTTIPTDGVLQGGTEGNSVKLQITKDLQFNEGLSTPDVSFDFEITGKTPNSPKATIDKAVFIKDEASQMTDGKQIVSKNLNVKFETFPHAGVYEYEVKETKGQMDGVTYDESVFNIEVHVANSSTMDGKTYIKAIVAKKNGQKAPIKFLNSYTKNNNLVIEKKITGELANLDQKFKFDVTIGNPNSSQKTFEGKILGNDGNPIRTITFNAGEMQTVELGNNQQLKFDAVEVGTRYSVKEVAAKDGYTPSVTVIENGNALEKVTVAEDKELEITNKLVGEKENKVTFVNDYNEISITGIIENNLPFIIMIGIAVVGVVLFVAVKKRKILR